MHSREYSSEGRKKSTILYGRPQKDVEKPIHVWDVASQSEITLDANHFEILLF